MKHKNIKLITALLMTASILTACGVDTNISKLTGDKLIKQNNGHLIVQGNVETKEVNINSKVAGKIKEVKITEGDNIKNGQVMITIENNSLVAKQSQTQAQIEAATGQMNAAQAAKAAALAQLQKIESGARPEELAQVKAQYDLAQKTYDRIKPLFDQGYVSNADLDNASTQLELAKQKNDLTKNGARPEEILMAKAQVNQAESTIQAVQGQIKQAEGGLSEVQTYISDTTIVAPVDGIVTQLNVEPGELVSTGMPLLVISSTVVPSIECNVKETDISKIKLAQAVTIKLSSYPNKEFKGKVVRINKKPDFAVKRATNDN